MDNKNRHVIGRSIVLERQERFSIETSQRIYFKGRNVYQNAPLDAALTSSSSNDIEKIHRTRERVESLNNKINQEIARLKAVNDSLNNRKEERLMTWDERFRANRPRASVLVPNRQHGGRSTCPDDLSKPASNEVKQRDVAPRKPPPRGLPPKGPSPKGLSKELTLQKSPPMRLPPKELPSKEFITRKPQPRFLPVKELQPKGLPPKGVPAKGLPLTELNSKKPPPKGTPPKELPSKNRPPKWVPSKEVPSEEVIQRKSPPNVLPQKVLPPKVLPPEGLQPKVLPPKDLPRKGFPPKELSSKEPSPKEIMTRKSPPKSSSQNELKPGKPPPKEVTTKQPLTTEKPMQEELRIRDSTPQKLATRICGGCYHCCWPCDHQGYYPTCPGGYIATHDNCNIEFNRGIQFGIPYCTAQRHVTDLNTEDICSNRCVGISPDRSSKAPAWPSSSPRETKKSPIRAGKTPTNENNRKTTPYKMPNKKLPKVESREKTKTVSSPGRLRNGQGQGNRKVESPAKIKENNKKETPLKKEYKPPETEVPKVDVVSPKACPDKAKTCCVDERLYQDYLSMYYQENSKKDLLEGPKPTPTYTKLREENIKPKAQRESPSNSQYLKNTDRIENPLNSRETKKATISQNNQEVAPPISNRNNYERREHQQPKTCIEKYPTSFRYETCFGEQGYRSPELPKNVHRERSSLSRETDSDSTSYATLPVKRQTEAPPTREANTTTETQRSKETSSLAYPLPSSEKTTQVYNGQQSNLSSAAGSPRKAQSPTIDSRRNSSPISFGEGSSRVPPSPTTESTAETTIMNPHYLSEDSLCHKKNENQGSCTDSSDENSDDDIESQINKEPGQPTENKTFEETFSTLSGKTTHLGNESPQGSFMCKEFKDFEACEMSDEEDPEEIFLSTRNDPQSKPNLKVDNGYTSFSNKSKDYSSPREDFQSRFDGYETARSFDSKKHPHLLLDRSFSPNKSGDETLPIVETVCEKRTRTVTFKDEQGDLNKQRQVEEQCRSHIDWEQALKYRQCEATLSKDNYSCCSSSSAEHTCIESSSDEEEAYDSCFETQSRKESFKACPCMYETYRQLAALCQPKSSCYR